MRAESRLSRIIVANLISLVALMESLTEFIRSNPDPRELKRALAVKMVKQGQSYYQIRDTLGISLSFISKYLQKFEREGIEGLKLKYKGSNGYLTMEQKQAVLDWLESKNYWQLSELKTYIEVSYGVRFASLQSYYSLFSEAGISWKKTYAKRYPLGQKSNPRKNPDLVSQKKNEIEAWLEAHREEILNGQLKVFFQDECHLLWGDICGAEPIGSSTQRKALPVCEADDGALAPF